MNIPDGNTIASWATAIATIIIIVRQQLNAQAGKKRGEEQGIKINDVHSTVTNGQIDILKTRALALRTVASLQSTPDNIKNADKAEQDFIDYLKGLGVNKTNGGN